MHGLDLVRSALQLRDEGLAPAAVANRIGVSPRTVRNWLADPARALTPRRARARVGCPSDCSLIPIIPGAPYAYLLGQYLGDGSIASVRNVYRLTITCCATYPGIMDECEAALCAVLPSNRVGRRARPGAVDVHMYSSHWPCLIPQHGPGPKHLRHIELTPWQRSIAMDRHPEAFARGLIHSDGCRSMNTVRSPAGRTYSYPRYQFSNRSSDVQRLFTEVSDRLGVSWRQMNASTVSVARSESVAQLDTFVGPKY